ncbi:MAG TPA: hypothetical protein DCR04_11420 [Flavobacteriales bacterium]|nr:hypothetical protein [Flavobacteriales bacterium]
MKTLIITAALAVSTLFHADASTVRTDVKQEIERSLSAHILTLPLEVNQKGLVRVRLKVDENGKLQIMEANYSHEKLRDLLVHELALITLDESATDQVFFYEFHFEKV